MKKVLVFLCLLFAIAASGEEPAQPQPPPNVSIDPLTAEYKEGFQNFKWGMSSEKAKNLIKKKYVQNQDDDGMILSYPDVMDIYPCTICLVFYKNHLYRVDATLTPPTRPTSGTWALPKWQDAYNGIEKILSKKYGPPKKVFPDPDPDSVAECEYLNDICAAEWRTDETDINLYFSDHFKKSRKWAYIDLFYVCRDISTFIEQKELERKSKDF